MNASSPLSGFFQAFTFDGAARKMAHEKKKRRKGGAGRRFLHQALPFFFLSCFHSALQVTERLEEACRHQELLSFSKRDFPSFSFFSYFLSSRFECQREWREISAGKGTRSKSGILPVGYPRESTNNFFFIISFISFHNYFY